MDDVLSFADHHFLDSVYSHLFPLSTYTPDPSTVLTNPTVKDSLKTFARSLAGIGVKQVGGVVAGLNVSLPNGSGVGLSSSLPSSPSSNLDIPLSLFPRDSIIRQSISMFLFLWISSFILYLSVSTITYYTLFDRRLEHHPRFLPNQVRREISLSLKTMPIIALLIVPWFVAEARGKTLMYTDIRTYGGEWFKGTWAEGYGHWVYVAAGMTAFLVFTDWCIYWIHRWLHIPWLYKRLHKPHHKWVVPTPFAALAFHPLDGYAQSIPYHIIPFILPIQKWVYLGMFGVVNLWTIVIHDGDMINGHILERYINSPAHHTLHHLYFTCNYGQYFTWADSFGGSYRPPRPDLDPIHEAVKNMERKKRIAEKTSREEARRAGRATTGKGEDTLLDVRREEEEEDATDSGYEGSETEMIREKEKEMEKEGMRKRR